MNTSLPTLTPLSLHDLWSIVKRRKIVIISTVIALTALGMLYCATATKKYTAQLEILIENEQKNVKIDAVTPDVPIDMTVVPSEIEVLTSRNLMGATLEKLGLVDHPDILYDPKGDFGRFSDSLSAMFKGTPSKLSAANAAAVRLRRRDGLINIALGNLKATQDEKSRGINLTYISRDPQFAANLLNTLAQVYIEQQVDHRYDSVRITNSWLSDRVTTLRKQVEQTDSASVKYRQENGLIDNHGADLIQQNISDLSLKLTTARTNLAEADSNLAGISDSKKLDSSPTVLASPLIQSLRGREADSKDELAKMSKDLGPQHPKIIAKKAEVRQIEREINQEVTKLAEGLRRERDVAAENVNQIDAQLTKLKTDYNQYMANNIQAQALDSEATSNRALLDTLNGRWKETQAQDDLRLQPADARIISYAAVPTGPSSPKTKLILAAAILAGLGLGTGLAIGMDQMQTGVYNGKQLQNITRVSNIALVPAAKDSKVENPIDYPLLAPGSIYSQAIRSISTFLRFKITKDSATRLVNFTSASGAEGKAAMVACLARQMALEGLNVVVVDCDLRAPQITKMFSLDGRPGLSDYLEGRSATADILSKDSATGLTVIGGGTSDDTNAIGHRTDNWNVLMKALSGQYDFVLLDTPPVLSIADSKLIAKASQNIVCVRWQKTPVKELQFALDTLARLECPLLGTAITMVDGNQKAFYGVDG